MLSWLEGYKLPFWEKPFQLSVPRPSIFSRIERDGVTSSITKMIDIGAIRQVSPVKGQFISKIFTVPKGDGSFRLIINLRELNKFISCHHFKLEDSRTVCRILGKNYFMATLDIQDAYTHLPIAKKHRKYLRFQFQQKLYEFQCLPFGLNTAPYVFTKIMKPVIQTLRSSGFLSVIYLDDFLLIGDSYESCKDNVLTTRKFLESLGFLLNLNKSRLTPSRQCRYLGFLYDSTTMKIIVPDDRKQKVLSLIWKYKFSRQCCIRDFARFLGALVSICAGTKYGWLYTKRFERQKFLGLMRARENYDACMTLSPSLLSDFIWWEDTLTCAENDIRVDNFDHEMFSDASLSGWGGFNNGQGIGGIWNSEDRAYHINYLELKATLLSLKHFFDTVSNANILCHIDNTTAIAYINRMGGVQYPVLNQITRQIWQWCEMRNNFIVASYIKSEENVEADRLSRGLSIRTEWELAPHFFQEIIRKFGTPEVDLFANDKNRKCEKFISWFDTPGAFAIDAFTISWRKFFFYAFPPFSMVLRVIRKIITDRAEGIVVVPFWPTQPWYPMFTALLTSDPFFLSPDKYLLISVDREPHPLWAQLTLVSGRLSARHLK